MAFVDRMGQELLVTMELPDGTIFSGKAMCAEIRQAMGADRLYYSGEDAQFVAGQREWTMELRGIGSMMFEDSGDFRHKVERKKSAIEWACDWCASINPRRATKCSSCGGARSFVYME